MLRTVGKKVGKTYEKSKKVGNLLTEVGNLSLKGCVGVLADSELDSRRQIELPFDFFVCLTD
jgi:uncharacterized protein (DUF2147 family)